MKWGLCSVVGISFRIYRLELFKRFAPVCACVYQVRSGFISSASTPTIRSFSSQGVPRTILNPLDLTSSSLLWALPIKGGHRRVGLPQLHLPCNLRPSLLLRHPPLRHLFMRRVRVEHCKKGQQSYICSKGIAQEQKYPCQRSSHNSSQSGNLAQSLYMLCRPMTLEVCGLS